MRAVAAPLGGRNRVARARVRMRARSTGVGMVEMMHEGQHKGEL